ncbi:MAG TPA: valine--tRNA ligase [Pirellulaceae bacterium]|nr:valine--tRNA ligase [Pirellulaceae bacterium]
MSADFSPEALPNRFDFAEAQPRIYAAWEAGKFFHAEPHPKREMFSIVIPPPNVTGALHLGHALNNTLQDIQIRMKRMQGFNTCWMPGTDHAGIATQAVVERRLREEEGKTRHDLGREELVERIWQWKEQYEARILSQLKQMGCSCDWERTRFTLDEGCSRAVRQTFFDLFSKGLIYRGKRLVNWDTFLQTAVSDDEVFQETVKGKFWHFRYPIIPLPLGEGGRRPGEGEPEFVEIATTRPETMLGDTAVAVHPDPARALDKAEAELRERLAKAPAKEKEGIEQQIDNIVRRRTEMLPQLLKLRDMAKAGRKVMLPLMKREIPLICDEWAKPELGSGCVKITPAHDPNDYAVWQRNPSIGIVNILNPDGTLNENAGIYKGMTIAKARQRVVDDLDGHGLLGDVEDREIELPHSDRSKTPIEPYLADQWFVKMGDEESSEFRGQRSEVAGAESAKPRPGLAQMAMDAVTSGRVKIIPERYAKSYLDWLGEKRDWPVSRQLWWGHRIPVWTKHAATKEVFSDDFSWVTGQISRDRETAGMSFDLSPNPSATPGWFGTIHFCLANDGDKREADLARHGFTRDPDVLDTWFSSALWPHSTFGWPERTPELAYFYPTSVLITNRDIISLWVARMVLTGLNNMGEVPFRQVYIHPTILDAYGERMSKSKGNGVDPVDIIDKFGADSLRYGLTSLTTETQDVRMPVQFECPHCQTLIEQTKKNRELPKIPCTKCHKEFSTQWASKPEDKALPRAAVVSERFEQARNFMNKLWNAARFALINLQGTGDRGQETRDKGPLLPTTEDRWILSRLSTVTQSVTESLEGYHYADAAKTLCDFAWDEFCSFYVEIAKARLVSRDSVASQDRRGAAAYETARRILAHTLDVLLRLLHPMMPFLTEEIWRLLNQVAPKRGLDELIEPTKQIIIAPWPRADLSHQNKEIEARFATFQAALAALREIRSRQSIASRQAIEFAIKCDAATAALLEPMKPYFQSMANAAATALGDSVTPPPTHAKTVLPNMEIYVDLKDFIDEEAEIAKNEQLEQKLMGIIKGKEAKLANESFVQRAPAHVVQAERDSLAQAQQQLAAVQAALASLRRTGL